MRFFSSPFCNIKTDSIDVRRECILKALCVHLNEDPAKLVKEYLVGNLHVSSIMALFYDMLLALLALLQWLFPLQDGTALG